MNYQSKGLTWTIIRVITAVIFVAALISVVTLLKGNINNILEDKVIPIFGIPEVEIFNHDQFAQLLDCLYALNTNQIELVQSNEFPALKNTSFAGCTVVGRVPKLIKLKLKAGLELPPQIEGSLEEDLYGTGLQLTSYNLFEESDLKELIGRFDPNGNLNDQSRSILWRLGVNVSNAIDYRTDSIKCITSETCSSFKFDKDTKASLSLDKFPKKLGAVPSANFYLRIQKQQYINNFSVS